MVAFDNMLSDATMQMLLYSLVMEIMDTGYLSV